jgi:hypothetical protein
MRSPTPPFHQKWRVLHQDVEFLFITVEMFVSPPKCPFSSVFNRWELEENLVKCWEEWWTVLTKTRHTSGLFFGSNYIQRARGVGLQVKRYLARKLAWDELFCFRGPLIRLTNLKWDVLQKETRSVERWGWVSLSKWNNTDCLCSALRSRRLRRQIREHIWTEVGAWSQGGIRWPDCSESARIYIFHDSYYTVGNSCTAIYSQKKQGLAQTRQCQMQLWWSANAQAQGK